MTLKAYEVCPHGMTCPHNNKTNSDNYCKGAISGRNTDFLCNLISENGTINESGFRSKYDETGKMKIIME